MSLNKHSHFGRIPMQVFDDLGRLLANPVGRRLALLAEAADNVNCNAATMRDRLRLFGVTNEEIELAVSEFEQIRAGTHPAQRAASTGSETQVGTSSWMRK